MFTSKANSKQKWVKISEIWMIWFLRNRVTFLENVSRFYAQNHYAFCWQKRGALAKTWHVFTVSYQTQLLKRKCDFSIILPQKSQLWSLNHPKWFVTMFMGSLHNKASKTIHNNIINNIFQQQWAIYHIL